MRKKENRVVTFKSTYWSYEEIENRSIIHISGITKDQKTVQVKVEGFTPFIYLELPKRIKWNEIKCRALFKYFQKIMGSNGPIQYKMFAKDRLHYKKRVNTIFISFPTGDACRKFSNKCMRSRSIYISGVGTFGYGELKVHEHNIDPVLKFTATKKISLAGWITVKERVPKEEEMLTVEERKFSSADIDLYASWRYVSPYVQEEEVVIWPKYCSFDIECYSKNHNSKLPNPDEKENEVFQIAMIFGRMGKRDGGYRKVLLSLMDPHDMEGIEIVRCFTEKQLLLKFSSLIREEDPDLFIGYNIMKFDWDYMIRRAERAGYYPRFMEISRIIGKKAELKKSSWASSAYGEQSFRYPNCYGRTNVDVLLEVERNFKLPKYSLDSVAEKFLGKHKDDITPRQLFMLFQMTKELLPKVTGEKKMSRFQLDKIKKRIAEIFPVRKTHGVVKELRNNLLNCKSSQIEDLIREGLTLTGKYCVQDTALPIQLAEKLNLWTTMEQMSNVMHVPTSYLHTRGQQIKVLAQVYRETIFNNIIIPYQDKKKVDENQKYQGAIVIEANPGDYDHVGTLDFASLYPTTMIAFNICYTTILEDDDPTPDEECHVLAWEDHVACPHDPQKRKRKKGEELCAIHRYRFRKVQISYDEKTGKVTRKHEGLMPRLERNLLSARKIVKKEMFKAEARLDMQRGKATDKDIEYYKKVGYEIIEEGSLGKNEEMMLEVTAGVLNAKQLAIKVSANSVGGNTPILCLIDGKICYRTIEELFSGIFEMDEYRNEVCPSPQSIKVWSDGGWADIEYVFRHKKTKPLTRILTHTSCVDVTGDHSLLLPDASPVKPSKVDIGNNLLHFDLPLPEDTPYTFQKIQDFMCQTREEKRAHNWGAFFADEEHEIEEYSDLFYTQRQEKKMPDEILNSGYNVRLSFLLGYCEYMGVCEEDMHFLVRGQIGAAGFYYLLKSLGYQVSVDYDSLDKNVFILSTCEDLKTPTQIKKKEVIPDDTISHQNHKEYVYDIETSTHHFAGGVGNQIVSNSAYGAMGAKTGFIPLVPGAASVTAMGRKLITMAIDRIRKEWSNCKLVYGDTDSCMIIFIGTTLKECFALCEKASKLATHYLKCYIVGVEEDFTTKSSDGAIFRLDKISSKDEAFKNIDYDDKIKVLEYESTPIDLEFENMYGRFLLLTKKRYVAHIYNKDGNITGVTKKGVVLARRDNSAFLRNVYKKMTDCVLDKKSEKEVMDILYEEINKLFTMRVPDTDLIIYTGVKNVMAYAKKDKKTDFFIDEYGDLIDDPVGPLDPRLKYPNLPQTLLSLKLINRGTEVPPNTRLEYLYIENEYAEHQGDKAEDYTYYKENKDIENLVPDYLHYIEKQLSNPVTELLGVKYPKEPILYEKLEDVMNRILTMVGVDSDVKRTRVLRTKKFERQCDYKPLPDSIGWEILEKNKYLGKDWVEKRKQEFRLSRPRVPKYVYSGKEAKVMYILDSAQKEGMHEFNPNIPGDAKIIDICKKWKARSVLDKTYSFYGMKKRPCKRPSQSGNKLRVNTKVILKRDVQGYPKGFRCKVTEITETEDKSYKYSLLMDKIKSSIITEVPRKHISTYYIRDGSVMKDILNARTHYKQVVVHLKNIFDPVKFVDV